MLVLLQSNELRRKNAQASQLCPTALQTNITEAREKLSDLQQQMTVGSNRVSTSRLHFYNLTGSTVQQWSPAWDRGIPFCSFSPLSIHLLIFTPPYGSLEGYLVYCVFCFFFCTVTHFSAAERGRGVKFCMHVGLLSGQVFSPFGEDWLAGSHGGGGISRRPGVDRRIMLVIIRGTSRS